MAETPFALQAPLDIHRGIKQLWNELCSLRFVDDARGALILGPVGVGKTHLATALGHSEGVEAVPGSPVGGCRIGAAKAAQSARSKGEDSLHRQASNATRRSMAGPRTRNARPDSVGSAPSWQHCRAPVYGNGGGP